MAKTPVTNFLDLTTEIVALAHLMPPTLHGCVSTATTAEQVDAFIAAFSELLR